MWKDLIMDQDILPPERSLTPEPAPYSQVPVKNFNITVIDRRGHSTPVKSGTRFRVSSGSNESLRNAVCGFCCVMTPYDRTGGDYSVFFVKEGTLEPFVMPLKDWIKNFQTGSFVILEGPANMTYLGNETPGAIPHAPRSR